MRKQTLKFEITDAGTIKSDGTDSQMTDAELAEILAALAGEVSLGAPADNVKTERHVHRPGYVHTHTHSAVKAGKG